MNRLFVFLAVVALVIALPVTHDAFAGNNNTKVEICHVNSANSPAVVSYTYWDNFCGSYYKSGPYTTTYVLGRVIEVDESAVDTHLANGDAQYFSALDDYWTGYLTSVEENIVDVTYSHYHSCGLHSWGYDYTNTNAVIKNANCWFYG
jgi:hypothetical protein